MSLETKYGALGHGCVWQLLLSRDQSNYVVEEWNVRRVESDLRLRRAKTLGMVVVETADTLLANWVWIQFDAPVAVKTK